MANNKKNQQRSSLPQAFRLLCTLYDAKIREPRFESDPLASNPTDALEWEYTARNADSLLCNLEHMQEECGLTLFHNITVDPAENNQVRFLLLFPQKDNISTALEAKVAPALEALNIATSQIGVRWKFKPDTMKLYAEMPRASMYLDAAEEEVLRANGLALEQLIEHTRKTISQRSNPAEKTPAVINDRVIGHINTMPFFEGGAIRMAVLCNQIFQKMSPLWNGTVVTPRGVKPRGGNVNDTVHRLPSRVQFGPEAAETILLRTLKQPDMVMHELQAHIQDTMAAFMEKAARARVGLPGSNIADAAANNRYRAGPDSALL